MIEDKVRRLSYFNNSGSEQEENEMLILPKAQLVNMFTSPTPDLTVTEMHSS